MFDDDLDGAGRSGQGEGFGQLLGGQAMGDQAWQARREFGIGFEKSEGPAKIAATRSAQP